MTKRTSTWRRLAPLLLLATLAGMPVQAGQEAGPGDSPPTVLITGANRGIGFAFAKHYAANGWRVIATARDPEAAAELQALARGNPAVTVEALDVTDLKAIDALAAKYRGLPIDILLNNAGILGGLETQKLGQLDYAVFDQVMAVNALAPIKVAEAFLDNVAAGRQKKIMTVTSSQGSIGGARPGGGYFYSASKAAVNMLMRKLALDLYRRGIVVGLLDPGAVDTNLMQPIKAAGFPIPLSAADDVVKDLAAVIDTFNLKNTGSYLTYQGKVQPW
ncbi:MAG: SDR family oxidoreductase [Gammaproteobacteria bacterium]